ncbi:unnamed protein product [Urochloa decumbens]|uniref:F-box domain-containing protein n=1 Tax=Urochloa decumbens TaxID=240449 RepID=A0ABC9BP67_9POAL
MLGEDQRRCSSGEDRISGLPDELLHDILVRLRSTRAAARTSLLSRRWRHVWAHLPELVLNEGGPDAPPPPQRASFKKTVNAAIDACLAPTLERLSITLSPLVPARRVTKWLRFASQRVVGTLSLSLVSPHDNGEESEIELPACTGAKSVNLDLPDQWRLRVPSSGLFTALTSLSICYARMEGSELTALVCTQCPRLRTLSLFTPLVGTTDFTIRSDSLLSVWLCLDNTRRLEIVAPRLEELCLSDAIEARISAPKLGKLAWDGDVYDPCRHHFVDVCRRLEQLDIGIGRTQSGVASLMQQFDEVDELEMTIYILQGIAGYESFLNETNNMPSCKTLSISLAWNDHGLTPAMLHLLKSCNSIRTLSVLLHGSYDNLESPCPSSCPCRFEESRRIDNVSLNSLQEIEITPDTSSHSDFEFIEHLSRCNAPVLKKLVINCSFPDDPPPTKETCEKIRNMCRPNIDVEFLVKGRVRLDW